MVARCWPLDKSRILPLVPLLKVSPEQLWQAAEGIAKSQDETRRLEFLTLGGLRYDKGQLRKLLEAAMLNILTPELIRESSFFEIMREAVEPMIAADNQIIGARRALRRVLKVRFPGLETAPELDNIHDVDRLESLIEMAAGETERSKMESAIQRDLITTRLPVSFVIFRVTDPTSRAVARLLRRRGLSLDCRELLRTTHLLQPLPRLAIAAR